MNIRMAVRRRHAWINLNSNFEYGGWEMQNEPVQMPQPKIKFRRCVSSSCWSFQNLFFSLFLSHSLFPVTRRCNLYRKYFVANKSCSVLDAVAGDTWIINAFRFIQLSDCRNIHKSFRFGEIANVIYLRYRDCGASKSKHLFTKPQFGSSIKSIALSRNYEKANKIKIMNESISLEMNK